MFEICVLLIKLKSQDKIKRFPSQLSTWSWTWTWRWDFFNKWANIKKKPGKTSARGPTTNNLKKWASKIRSLKTTLEDTGCVEKKLTLISIDFTENTEKWVRLVYAPFQLTCLGYLKMCKTFFYSKYILVKNQFI